MDVRSMRKRLGMTQRELASVLGTYQRTVYAWEAGKHRPLGVVRTILVLLDSNPSVVLPMLRSIQKSGEE